MLAKPTHLPACQAQKPARSPSPPTCLLAKLRNLHARQAYPLACSPSSKTCTFAKFTHLPACQVQKSARSPRSPLPSLPSSKICDLNKVTPAFSPTKPLLLPTKHLLTHLPAFQFQKLSFHQPSRCCSPTCLLTNRKRDVPLQHIIAFTTLNIFYL